MADGFRIQSVEIEGFKGFTTPQSIDFKGRHIFLLGRNNNGKSSIVEAIRWGLFGSINRPGEVVANSGYSGACRVVLTLTRGGRQWQLRRTLIRGASGGSDARLYDENGQEQLIREVIPLLDSVDAGEGTHIIFSSQSAPLGRQPADLNSFQRTVLNHLGLLRPQSLLSHLDSFMMNQELLEGDLSTRLTNARRKVDIEIDELERQRGRILHTPPWGSGQAPTLGQSENKARSLIEEISGNSSDNTHDGMSFLALIEIAEDALEERRQQDQGELLIQSAEIVSRRKRLEALQDALNDIESQKSSIKSMRLQLDDALEGKSFAELRRTVDETREDSEVTQLRRRVVDGAISLVNRNTQHDDVLCPVCEMKHLFEDLQSSLLQISTELSSAGTSERLNQLENQLSKCERLEASLKNLTGELANLEQTYLITLDAIAEEDKSELSGHITSDGLDAVIARRQEREKALGEQIEGNEGQLNALGVQLSRLRDEDRFHQLQQDLLGLSRAKTRFTQVERANKSLVSFGESVRRIRQVVETCFNEQLRENIPSVSDNLSKVFYELTCHPYFDRLFITEDTLPNLELRVASTQDSLEIGHHPSSVLNGQAESALKLVPYFAFSQADDAATDMHLMMLDDPTQAFDEEHTEILIERLVDLGEHVQLLVASQETDRFQKFLPKHFERDIYVIVEPTNWSYHYGPELKIDAL